MKLLARRPVLVKAWPMMPISIIHEVAGGMVQIKFIPCARRTISKMNRVVVGSEKRTTRALARIAERAFW